MFVSSAWIWYVFQLHISMLSVTVFSAPNIPLYFPKARHVFLKHSQMCWSPNQLVCSESVFVRYKANAILYYVCAKKGDKEPISPYLYYSLLISQSSVFLTSSSPISNEERTAYKLSASNLFAGDLVVPQGPGLVLPDSRQSCREFPLTELFILATLSLLSEWLKKTL